MSEVRRTNQGGSTVTFVIIGAILTLLLISSVYFLKQHGQQVRKDQAIASYEKQQSDEDSKADSELAQNSAENNNSELSLTGTAVNQEELPVTGTKLIIFNLIEIGLLAFVISSYVVSRRNLVHSLDL